MEPGSSEAHRNFSTIEEEENHRKAEAETRRREARAFLDADNARSRAERRIVVPQEQPLEPVEDFGYEQFTAEPLSPERQKMYDEYFQKNPDVPDFLDAATHWEEAYRKGELTAEELEKDYADLEKEFKEFQIFIKSMGSRIPSIENYFNTQDRIREAIANISPEEAQKAIRKMHGLPPQPTAGFTANARTGILNQLATRSGLIKRSNKQEIPQEEESTIDFESLASTENRVLEMLQPTFGYETIWPVYNRAITFYDNAREYKTAISEIRTIERLKETAENEANRKAA